MTPIQLITGIVVVAAAGWLIVRFARAYRAQRGKRLVSCPENQETVAVEVAAARAALRAVSGGSEVDLKACTRWPEKEDCGQECLAQIATSHDGCLVSSMVRTWYAGKQCAVCGKPFGEINWHSHQPALIDAAGRTVLWSDVRVEDLPKVLETHRPVCWDCHVVETLYREHPEIVTERPQRETPY
ncbi:MAG: hypothetical protein PVF43_10500 [Candidatus Eiseniibacteriota bacterium]|jgi:hypothetical protein